MAKRKDRHRHVFRTGAGRIDPVRGTRKRVCMACNRTVTIAIRRCPDCTPTEQTCIGKLSSGAPVYGWAQALADCATCGGDGWLDVRPSAACCCGLPRSRARCPNCVDASAHYDRTERRIVHTCINDAAFPERADRADRIAFAPPSRVLPRESAARRHAEYISVEPQGDRASSSE